MRLMPQRTDPYRLDTWDIQNHREHPPKRYRVRFRLRGNPSLRHIPSRKDRIHISPLSRFRPYHLPESMAGCTGLDLTCIDGAETGMIINSRMSTLLAAWVPPLRMFIMGTGRIFALIPPIDRSQPDQACSFPF